LRDVFAAGVIGPRGLDDALALVLRNGGELDKWKPHGRSSELRHSRFGLLEAEKTSAGARASSRWFMRIL
jgi:hypothetical protein